MFGDVQPQLALEEYKALAGVWRTDVKLGPIDTTIWLHLDAPRLQQDGGSPPGGVHPSEDNLHLATPQLQQFVSEYPPGGVVHIMPVWSKHMERLVCRDGPQLTSAWWSASRPARA